MKPYDVGLICGRFQTYHIGHESLINMGTQLCDRMEITSCYTVDIRYSRRHFL